MRLRVKPTKKQARQDIILKLIKEKEIRTQEELTRSLEKFGFKTTQSSLSRDIAELGLTKQHGSYIIPPRGMHGSTPLVTEIDSAGPNMLVVKTLVGMAAPVGITIDGQKNSDIIGTIAGDDTVFVALSNNTTHETVKKAIFKLFKAE